MKMGACEMTVLLSAFGVKQLTSGLCKSQRNDTQTHQASLD